MLVSIILPTIRTGTVSAAIEAIMRQTDDNWELIVVPQGDDTKLLDVIGEFSARDPRVRFVHTPKKNSSHGRNVGMAAVKGDIIAFTDDDCEVTPDWIAVMRELYDENPDIGFLGGKVIAPPSTQPWRISTCPAAHVLDAKYFPLRDNWTAPVGFYMIGANISIRREIAEKVGKFDEVFGAGSYFGSCEDQDFALRAELLGTGFMSSNRLVVNHTSGRRYGFRDFFKHQRAYGRGRGAWAAKLRLWGHPAIDEWQAKRSLAEHAHAAFTRPHKWLLRFFNDYYARQTETEYYTKYLLGDDLLSHPRPPPTHPAQGTRKHQSGSGKPTT